MQDRILRAQELLKTIRHAAMATVNVDGSPHNTPYFFACSPDITKLYWRSRVETQHSKNIARSGQLFVVLYEAANSGSGLYIKAERGKVAEGTELEDAIIAFSAAREKAGRTLFDHAAYTASEPKFYTADVTEMWVNGADQDENGLITRDYREPVAAEDLLR